MEEVVRLREANRKQLSLEPIDLDSRLAADHPARAIWRVLEGMDLSRFEAAIKAREGVAGRDATDPKILLALWLYALSDGVASAREVERLSSAHDAYKWICGGVSVNHHLLSDFRVAHGTALDELMSQVLAVLMHKKLVRLYRVAQDGTRVRASAGAGSFRRKPRLEQCLQQARAHLQALQHEAEHLDPQRGSRAQAAQARAAREYQQRLEQALAELPKVAAHKKNRQQAARVSSTDPEARVMKMGDGGFRPAYNVQFATDTESRIIVGVGVSNAGTDTAQLEPMLEQIERRTGKLPEQALVDGGFTNFASLERAAADGVEVFAPLRSKNKTYRLDPMQPHPADSPAIAEYRARMASPQAHQIYQQRAATAETVNADLKTWRGLDRLLVRGSAKVLAIATWSALTYNLMRAIRMGWL
jgi:transposase